MKLGFIKIVFCLMLMFSSISVYAQYSMGTTGLLNIPTADMQEDGHFMVGANYMPQELLSSLWEYNSANYFLNITFLPFLEVTYRCTLRIRTPEFTEVYGGKYGQDRAISVRVRLFKERKWLPAIVIGTDDIFTTSFLNPFADYDEGNRSFASIYGVATKHFKINNSELGFTVGYNYATQELAYNEGIFYGLSFTPALCNNLKLMADVNNNKLNMGASMLMWNHLSAHIFCHNFETLSAGLRYEIDLY